MINKTKLRFMVLSSLCIGKPLIALNYRKLSSFTSNRWGGGSFHNEIKKQFAIFLLDDEQGDLRITQKLSVDIIWSYYRYGSTPDEYFFYNFRNLSDRERKKYLTTKKKDDECRKFIPISQFVEELENKYNFYCRMRDFYRREAFLLNDNSNKEEFRLFFMEKGSLFFKPLEGQCGQGAHIEQYNQDLFSDKYDFLVSEGKSWIVEELIKQDETTALFNTSSVNSVRVNTFNTNKGIEVYTCFLRVGRQGSVCDNGGLGGILLQLEDTSGVIVSDGYDEKGNVFVSHPDSGIRFKGYQLPDWDKLIETAKTAHMVLNHHKFIGWDFAYTINKEWVLIEGNWGAFISQQITRGYGIKKEFLELMHS